MQFAAIAALINFVTSLVFGFFVFYKKKAFANKIFFIFSLSIAFWSFFYFLWQLTPEYQTAIFYLKMLTVGSVFIPVLYLHFNLIFLSIEKTPFNRISLRIIYFLSVFFALIAPFTNWMVDGASRKMSFEIWPNAGVLYGAFLVVFFFCFIYSAFLFWIYFKKSIGNKKEQLRFFLLSVAFGLLGGTTNFFLWYDIPISPYGNIFVSVYVLFMGYAIIKYQLFNIKLVLAQFLTVAIWLLIFIQLFFAENTSSFILISTTLLIAIIFGIFLIRSVKAEVQRKEELQVMSDKLASTNDQLRKLDNAKSEFISIASHQLRTPLTAIKGFLSLMLEGSYGKLEAKHEDVLNKVYVSTERLINLVEDLLNISRIESGRMEYKFDKWDVAKMCDEVVDTFFLRAKDKGLYLDYKKPENGFPQVETDGSKLREVISNLVDNALKYTQRGGISIRLLKEGSFVKIVVSDTGIGIPKDELPYLFSKFSRGKDTTRLNTGGTGLGLFVGKSIVESLAGKIWAESEGAGKGSKFIIELPIEKEAEE